MPKYEVRREGNNIEVYDEDGVPVFSGSADRLTDDMVARKVTEAEERKRQSEPVRWRRTYDSDTGEWS